MEHAPVIPPVIEDSHGVPLERITHIRFDDGVAGTWADALLFLNSALTALDYAGRQSADALTSPRSLSLHEGDNTDA